MAATLAVDRQMVRLFEPLKPHKSAHSITGYRQMSDNFSWPKPVVATVSAALATPVVGVPDNAMDEFLA